jgi:hypothetical protein
MQNHYNLIYREEEREMFPTLKVGSLSFGSVIPVLAVWLISIFPAFRCWLHPVVSAWQRLVDPPVRRED